MKSLLTISLTALLLLLSCNSNKEVVQYSEVSKDSTCTTLSYQLERFVVDTTKTSDWLIVISEEEYYPPTDTATASMKRKVTKTIRHKSECKGITQSIDSIAVENKSMLKSNVIKQNQEQTKAKSIFNVPWWVWVLICLGIYVILCFVVRKIAKQ